MNVESVFLQAKAMLEAGQYRQARDLGHSLLKARFSGAFEILAASFQGEGALDVAITVLQNGVHEAPGVWTLWMQLGNYRSQAGLLVEAQEAYMQARVCPHADLEQIGFNEAVMRMRYGNKERALELFGKVIKSTDDRRLRLVALIHRLSTLIDLGQVTEALMELGEAYLHDSDNAELLSSLAAKLLEAGDPVNALNLAKQALGLKRAGQVADVVRKIEGVLSDRCRIYEVTLNGKFEDHEGIWRYFTKSSRVYARDRQEAEALSRAFEPPDVRPHLEVGHIREVGEASQEPLGVAWSSELELIDAT